VTTGCSFYGFRLNGADFAHVRWIPLTGELYSQARISGTSHTGEISV